jgi:hypothetical protein
MSGHQHPGQLSSGTLAHQSSNPWTHSWFQQRQVTIKLLVIIEHVGKFIKDGAVKDRHLFGIDHHRFSLKHPFPSDTPIALAPLVAQTRCLPYYDF